MHKADCQHSPQNRPAGEQIFYRTVCTECGGLVCYADDSTYSVTANNEEELSAKMSSKFLKRSRYLTENRLCINTDKTHKMVLYAKQRRRYIDTEAVSLNTGTELITPTQLEFLLGVKVHPDLGFNTNIGIGRRSE